MYCEKLAIPRKSTAEKCKQVIVHHVNGSDGRIVKNGGNTNIMHQYTILQKFYQMTLYS